MARKEFTKEQMQQLLENPYTAKVTPYSITHTIEFKRLIVRETEAGRRPRQIYENAGYDAGLLGNSRMQHFVKRTLEEAVSPGGLKEPENKRQAQIDAFAAEDLSRIESEKAIKKLQTEVIKLEQEVEFLKKILSLHK